MEKNFPMASKEELSKNSDDCPICWDKMETGRKLPCGHLFHNSCLRSWLEQDTSCPTCRKSLRNHQIDSSREINSIGNFTLRNRLYHFDGPRYASWLPSVAVEVARPVNSINLNEEINVFTGSSAATTSTTSNATSSTTSNQTATTSSTTNYVNNLTDGQSSS